MDSIYINMNNVKQLNRGPCFHGELWYSCPHCGKGIESYDIAFQRGVKKLKDNIYQCDKCKGLFYYNR